MRLSAPGGDAGGDTGAETLDRTPPLQLDFNLPPWLGVHPVDSRAHDQHGDGHDLKPSADAMPSCSEETPLTLELLVCSSRTSKVSHCSRPCFASPGKICALRLDDSLKLGNERPIGKTIELAARLTRDARSRARSAAMIWTETACTRAFARHRIQGSPTSSGVECFAAGFQVIRYPYFL